MAKLPLIAPPSRDDVDSPLPPSSRAPLATPPRAGALFFYAAALSDPAACRTPMRAPIREPRHTTWPCTRVCTHGGRGNPPLRAPGRGSRARVGRMQISGKDVGGEFRERKSPLSQALISGAWVSPVWRIKPTVALRRPANVSQLCEQRKEDDCYFGASKIQLGRLIPEFKE